jgi:hypothetical protein
VVIIRDGSSVRGSRERHDAHQRNHTASQDSSRVSEEENDSKVQVAFAKGSKVEVFGLRSADSLNGMIGTVLDALTARNRSVVRIGGKKLSMRNANLRLVTSGESSALQDAQDDDVATGSSNSGSRVAKETSSMTEGATNAGGSTASRLVGGGQGSNNPSITKFVKLLRRGVSRTAIEFQMKQAGIDPSLLPSEDNKNEGTAGAGEASNSMPAPAIVLVPPPPVQSVVPKEPVEQLSRNVPARSSDAILLPGELEPNPEAEPPCTEALKHRKVLQLNLSEQLGSIQLRKTKSEGGAMLHERLTGGSGQVKSGKGGGMSWLESLRTNPKFNAIRRASLSAKAADDERDRSESLSFA